MSTRIRVELFGGVRIGSDEDLVPVPSMRASVLVAALVLADGATVSGAELRTLMWPSGEPASAANQLHRLVGQVRRFFEPGLSPRDAGAFVTGSSAGYRLDPSRVHSDLEDCRIALDRARRVEADQDWDRATEHYLLALEVLRRPLLGDPSLEGAGHPGFSAVARMRVAAATEALACARLCGRLEPVVALVEQVAGPLPFEESLQAALISALAQLGRRRDAMSLYDAVRRALADELGVDPGSELRSAHEALLRVSDDEPSQPMLTGHGVPDVRPAQLPASLRGMTARPEAQQLLDDVARAGAAGAVVITSIGGMGGIGKTTLAVAWARSLAPRFPDGQLYVNLRGFDAAGRVTTPMGALSELLLALGVASLNADESLEARSARFRGVVADRKLLLLLDNARDAEQVRPLLPGGPGCLVIVTSRNQMASLVVREGAVPLRLDRMRDDQARELLTRRLGAVRMALEPEAVDLIIRAASGLPLALAIVAARLAADADLRLGAVADELTESSRLAAWSAGEPEADLASVFDWSYELLDAESARVLRVIAIHPGPEVSLSSIASISGLDVPATRRLTSGLVAASLLERRGQERFVVHDLLREYAGSRLTDAERQAAGARLVAHYVLSTRNAWDVHGRPAIGDLDPVTELPGLSPETFEEYPEATDWYVRERAVLPAVLHLAAARGWDRAAANIGIDWRPMNQTIDMDADTYPHAQAALAAAERTGDAVLKAELHRDLGPKAVRLGDAASGLRHLEEARELYALLGDRVGEANVLRNLSTTPSLPRAVRGDHLRTAIGLVPGEVAPQAMVTLKLGLASYLTDVEPGHVVGRGEWLEAERLLSEAIPVILAHGWSYLMPVAAHTLSEVLMKLSRPREALDMAVQGMPFALAAPLDLAGLHVRAAEAALAIGDRERADQACRDFYDLLDRNGRDHVEGMLAQAMFSMGADQNPFDSIKRVEEALSRVGD